VFPTPSPDPSVVPLAVWVVGMSDAVLDWVKLGIVAVVLVGSLLVVLNAAVLVAAMRR